MRLPLLLALTLLCAACGDGPPVMPVADSPCALAASEPPAGFEAAQERARRLGAFLAPRVAEADRLTREVQEQGGDDVSTRFVAAKTQAFTLGFGPPLPSTVRAEGGREFAACYRTSRSGLGDVERLDGRPLLVVWGLSPQAFFYEGLVVDLHTGALTQGHEVMRGDATDLHGTLVPPDDARLTGSYTREQREELAALIRGAAAGAD